MESQDEAACWSGDDTSPDAQVRPLDVEWRGGADLFVQAESHASLQEQLNFWACNRICFIRSPQAGGLWFVRSGNKRATL